MEKIGYLPLINHIKERSDFYNQLFRENELKYSQIDHTLVSSWMVNSIEPIIVKTQTVNPDQLPQVFKAFYTELLKILGNNLGVAFENEYRLAWAICLNNPRLVGTFPSRILNAINSALESIRSYQPEKVLLWISMMDKTIASCNSLDEFMACGRIYAWVCGLAQFRLKAELEFNKLGEELKQLVKFNISKANNSDFTFESEWVGVPTPTFMGEVGGYIGMGGLFNDSPMVAQMDDNIVITDRNTSSLLFADRFGKVIIPDIQVTPESVIKDSNTRGLKEFKSKFGDHSIPFDDVTSCLLNKSTLILTRKSSHYLFVYGWTQ